MYGLYSSAASNQERPMMARVRYLFSQKLNFRSNLFDFTALRYKLIYLSVFCNPRNKSFNQNITFQQDSSLQYSADTISKLGLRAV